MGAWPKAQYGILDRAHRQAPSSSRYTITSTRAFASEPLERAITPKIVAHAIAPTITKARAQAEARRPSTNMPNRSHTPSAQIHK